MEFHQLRDCDAWRKQGLQMNTNSNECVKLYDAALSQYITWYDNESYGGLEKTLENMMNNDPNFILGHCLNHGLGLIGISPESCTSKSKEQLLEFNKILDKNSNKLTKRELDHAKAVQCLYKGDLLTACDVWENILHENPTDMMAIKFASDVYFYLGYHSQMRDSVARVLPHWKKSMPMYSNLYGIYSFGLVQSCYFEQAKTAATKALEMNKNDGWATHSMAHYYEYSTEYDLGIKFLSQTESDWSICNILSSHNYWHLALYHIEKSEHETAINIYRNHILKDLHADKVLDMVDAISLLYRLKLDSTDIMLKNEWNEIANIFESKIENHGYIFNDSHIAMMLSESDNIDNKNLFLSSLHDYINADRDSEEMPGSNDFMKKLNSQYANKIYKAINCFSNQEFSEVVDLLYPLRYKIIKIGGSNAQRDIFQQILIQAALRSNDKFHNKIGLALLNERRALKPNSKMTERLANRFASLI